jgi:hypothetical protein
LLGRRTDAAEQVEDHARVYAKVPADQADDDDRANTETTPTSGHSARCAGLAIVFDIAAGPEIICAHLSFSNRAGATGGGHALSIPPGGNERLFWSNDHHAAVCRGAAHAQRSSFKANDQMELCPADVRDANRGSRNTNAATARRPGRVLRLEALPAFSPSPSSPAAATHQPQQQQQHDRTYKGIEDQSHEPGAEMDTEPRQKPIADKRADQANDQVPDQAETAAFHYSAGKPSGDNADDQDNDETLIG